MDKSCYQCKMFSLCTVREAAGVFLQVGNAYIEPKEGSRDQEFYKFLGERCTCFTVSEDAKNE